MAYGPPAKKPKTDNDEETKSRDQDRCSNGMEFLVTEKESPLRCLRIDERKLIYLMHNHCRCKPREVLGAEHYPLSLPILFPA